MMKYLTFGLFETAKKYIQINMNLDELLNNKYTYICWPVTRFCRLRFNNWLSFVQLCSSLFSSVQLRFAWIVIDNVLANTGLYRLDNVV